MLKITKKRFTYDNYYMTMADIKDILKYRQISLDNLDITW